MDENNHVIIICECGSTEHQVLFRTFDLDENERHPEVYMDVHLVRRRFWDRVKYAFKYIFGYKSRYGAWDEIILSPKHIPALEEIVTSLKREYVPTTPTHADTVSSDT